MSSYNLLNSCQVQLLVDDDDFLQIWLLNELEQVFDFDHVDSYQVNVCCIYGEIFKSKQLSKLIQRFSFGDISSQTVSKIDQPLCPARECAVPVASGPYFYAD